MTATRHECLTRIDEELANYNTRLAQNLFNWNDVFVQTERIRSLRDGQNPKQVIASYCPFCGKKLVRKKTVLS